jgi:hypothetical protein
MNRHGKAKGPYRAYHSREVTHVFSRFHEACRAGALHGQVSGIRQRRDRIDRAAAGQCFECSLCSIGDPRCPA